MQLLLSSVIEPQYSNKKFKNRLLVLVKFFFWSGYIAKKSPHISLADIHQAAFWMAKTQATPLSLRESGLEYNALYFFPLYLLRKFFSFLNFHLYSFFFTAHTDEALPSFCCFFFFFSFFLFLLLILLVLIFLLFLLLLLLPLLLLLLLPIPLLLLQGFSSERADYWTLSFLNDKEYEKNENSSK